MNDHLLCRHCGAKLQQDDVKCARCGAPGPAAKDDSTRGFLLYLIVLTIICIAAIFLLPR